MFIWVLVIVVLAVFWVYNWAELGARMQGRNLWLVLGWSIAALLSWQVALEALRLQQLLAFLLFLLVLVAGYYQLHSVNPKPKSAHLHKKPQLKNRRAKRAHK